MPTRDPYELLGVSKEASGDDVRRAYRRLARKYHPDANPADPDAEERFKEIQQAYEVLSTPEKRRNHDQRVRASSRKSRDGSRAGAGARPRSSSNASRVNIADLIARRGGLSRGRKQFSWELRGEDASRVAKLLGVNLDHLSKLIGEAVTMRAQATFGGERPGAPKEGRSGESPPGGQYEKPPIPRMPPIPRKPPMPPRTGGP